MLSSVGTANEYDSFTTFEKIDSLFQSLTCRITQNLLGTIKKSTMLTNNQHRQKMRIPRHLKKVYLFFDFYNVVLSRKFWC